MITYLDRPQQTAHCKSRGLKLGEHSIRDRTARGEGPRYVVIMGKALSTREWLDEWIDGLAEKPFRGRPQAQRAQAVQS